jgi:Rrf2 family transcriptional regulator, iron-sulfur cluster assembly transcription factor
MKLTTRGHYSVKALLDLSLQPAGQVCSVSAISARQSLPAPYLEKLLIELRRSHLVSSVRGANGGYRLAKAPAQISLGQILEAVGESTSALASGMTSGMTSQMANQTANQMASGLSSEFTSDTASSGAEDWVTAMLWQRLQQKLKEAFYSITLEDLYYDARSWQAAQGEGASFVV